MLFLVSGASAAGKTTLVRLLTERIERIAVHELGEFADRPWNGEPGWLWRRAPLERALEHARVCEARGDDMLVTEGVLGELLAAPAATELEGIAACLVDCGDGERVARLRARENGREDDRHQLWDHLVWALWLRRHADDPQLFAGPIMGGDDGGWAWSRWSNWQRGDRRWQTFVLDTTGQSIDSSIDELESWIARQRVLRDDGQLPLSADWSAV